MEISEKLQIVESLKTIIKARWFFAATVFVQGLIIKYFFPGVPLAPAWQLLIILAISYIYNISFRLYIQQPVDKITDSGIKIIRFLQLPSDAASVTSILYFSGTVDKLLVVWYFVALMVGIAIYGKKGIFWGVFFCSFLYSGLAILEYNGLLNTPTGAVDFLSVKGNLAFLGRRIIAFDTYMIAAGFFCWFLGDLFRQREKRLVDQRNELSQKTDLLTDQTLKLTAAKADLEGEKNKVEAVIKSLTDGLMLLDSEGKILLVNKVAKHFLDIDDVSQLLNKKLWKIETPIFKRLNDILAAKSGQIVKAEMALPKPSDLILEISTADVHETDNRYIGKIIVLHDVTREKAIDKIKSDFVSITAHQLRTPLTAIKWVFDILLAGDTGKISREQQEIINKGNKSNDRIITLIDDLLEVARIEEGRFDYKFTDLPFTGLLDTTLKKFSRLIEEKKIKVEVIKPANFDPVIKADEEKLGMALFNLIENALRYTPENGTVAISFSPNPENKKLNFEIKDSGIGIPKDNYNRIFSKFFRGENAVKAETDGSGLGLFIVKNIIEAHGGKIWFESTEGVGTTFYLSLPVEKSS